MKLPGFRYHPDPIATGSIVPSDRPCVCCGQARGFVYALTPFGEGDYEPESICPWCIADGRAAADLDASFVSGELIDEQPVPPAALRELCLRTPGFATWQGDGRWMACCGDLGELLGPAGHAELIGPWSAAVAAVQRESGFSGVGWDDYFRSLSRDRSPTAYLFRCRRCGALGGYSDYS